MNENTTMNEKPWRDEWRVKYYFRLAVLYEHGLHKYPAKELSYYNGLIDGLATVIAHYAPDSESVNAIEIRKEIKKIAAKEAISEYTKGLVSRTEAERQLGVEK